MPAPYLHQFSNDAVVQNICNKLGAIWDKFEINFASTFMIYAVKAPSNGANLYKCSEQH